MKDFIQEDEESVTNSYVLITLPQSHCLNYCQHIANLVLSMLALSPWISLKVAQISYFTQNYINISL